MLIDKWRKRDPEGLMPSPRSPFVVRIILKTAIVMDRAMTLDAIVTGTACRVLDDEEGLKISPFTMTQGVAHASQAFIGAELARMNSFAICRREREVRDPFVIEMFKDVSTSARDVTPGVPGVRRPNLLNEREGRLISDLVFLAHGDLEEVRYWLSHVHMVGGRRNGGHGEVAAITVSRLDGNVPEGFGLIGAHGGPVRPLPLPLWQELGAGGPVTTKVCRTGWPYWLPGGEACAVPHDVTAAMALGRLEEVHHD